MSVRINKKAVVRETRRDYSLPKETERIARIVSIIGNCMFEVEDAEGHRFIANMRSKYKRVVWLLPGHYVLVEMFESKRKLQAQIVSVLTDEHVEAIREEGLWPKAFDNSDDVDRVDAAQQERSECDEEDELESVLNRPYYLCEDSDEDSEEDNSETEEEEEEEDDEDDESSDQSDISHQSVNKIQKTVEQS